MEAILIGIAIAAFLYFRFKKQPNEISLSISLPDKGRPETITGPQERLLSEWGLSGFSNASKQQASIVISCIRYSERVCEILDQQKKLKPTYMATLIEFICNDEEFRGYVHERNTRLWKEGVDEDDVEPEKDAYYYKLKKFIEK